MAESTLCEQERYPSSAKLPLASIIIPNYNYEKFLPRAIDSALQQTYPVKEIIVVDDGSTDNSRHIISQYEGRIKPIFQKNKGRASALNTGVLASRGEIIFFLDADDTFFPHKVEEMVGYYLQVVPQTPGAMIFHCLEMTTKEGIVLGFTPKRLQTLDGHKKNGPFEKLSDPEAAYRHVQKWGYVPFFTSPTSGLSLTKSLAGSIFPLPEAMKRNQDSLLAFAAMLLGTLYGTSQILGSYILHGDNISLAQRANHGSNDPHQITENFLNDLLQKMGKERIASFYESRYARTYYKSSGSIKGLLKLVYKVPARCFCWKTICFSLRTLKHCLRLVLGITGKTGVPRASKLFEKEKERQAKD